MPVMHGQRKGELDSRGTRNIEIFPGTELQGGGQVSGGDEKAIESMGVNGPRNGKKTLPSTILIVKEKSRQPVNSPVASKLTASRGWLQCGIQSCFPF